MSVVEPKVNKNVISATKNMKNKANLKPNKFTTKSCSIGGYNAFPPKTQNGTNPIKANFRNGKPPIFQNNKKMENEPNFNESKVLQVTAIERFTTLFPKRKRTQTNPIKPIKANFPEKGDFQNDVGNLEFLIPI